MVDTSDTSYDPIGRPVQVARAAPAEGDASTLRFDYDGQLGGPPVPGQLGRMNRVRGDGWERGALFDALGRAYHQDVTLTGWRDVTSDKTYRADGSVASDTLTIADATGSVFGAGLMRAAASPAVDWIRGEKPSLAHAVTAAHDGAMAEMLGGVGMKAAGVAAAKVAPVVKRVISRDLAGTVVEGSTVADTAAARETLVETLRLRARQGNLEWIQ